MTPQQIKSATAIELVTAYKEKARCFHSEYLAGSIFNELNLRLGKDALHPISLATWHMQHGEGDAEFNDECDKLIKLLSN